MPRTKFWIISLATFVLVCGLGFGIYQWLQPREWKGFCKYSQVANLALQAIKDPTIGRTIHQADGAYNQKFSEICARLCLERNTLSAMLLNAKKDDPRIAAAFSSIHELQARMELMTWNHILLIRDMLPPTKRAQYIHNVQSDWAKGQARLRHRSQMNHCQMEHNQ